MRTSISVLLFTAVFVTGVKPLFAQERADWKDHPNNIKFNLSSGLIYRNAFILGYERTVNAHQTFSVFGGTQKLPSFSGLVIPGIEMDKENRHGGYNFGADYRFYLAKENKYAPPHGLYIGPYTSFYYFKNDNTALFTFEDGSTADGSVKSDFRAISVGAQLGYQFVFWKRMTVDLLLFGPSITRYAGTLQVQSTIDPAKVSEEVKKILEAIGDRYPVIGEAIKNGSADAKGKVGIWGPGFRYSVHVGFRF